MPNFKKRTSFSECCYHWKFILFPVPDPRNDYVDLQQMNSDQDIKGRLLRL